VSEDGPVELEIGKICGKRWKIIDKLGEGGCGSVYKVQDIHTMAKVTYNGGTTRYCSANAHLRSEQGRPDDLWSMVYVLAEMRGALPWDRVRGKEEIGKVKMATSDTKLCRNSPKELLDVSDLTIENLHYAVSSVYNFSGGSLGRSKYERNVRSKIRH
ncbi:Putative serine/threonine-protein kinase K06H7.1, partial [Toxocara canis]